MKNVLKKVFGKKNVSEYLILPSGEPFNAEGEHMYNTVHIKRCELDKFLENHPYTRQWIKDNPDAI